MSIQGWFFGRHLVGVWIGGVWNGHFPESEKYFLEAEFSRKIPEIPQKERFFQISGSEIFEFENSEPEKLQFHTPSHSIPPLDSLLVLGPPSEWCSVGAELQLSGKKKEHKD